MFSRSDLAELRADLIAAGASAKDATLAAKDIGHSVWCFGEGGHFFGDECRPLPFDMNEGRRLMKTAREQTLHLIKATEIFEAALNNYMPFGQNAKLALALQQPRGSRGKKKKPIEIDGLLEMVRDDVVALREVMSTLPSALQQGRRAPDSNSGLMFMQCAWAWKRSTGKWPSRGLDKVNRSEPKAPLHRNIIRLLRKQTGHKPRGTGTACYVRSVTTLIENKFPFPLEQQMFGRQLVSPH